jgi:hypothetical protein
MLMGVEASVMLACIVKLGEQYLSRAGRYKVWWLKFSVAF